MTDETTVEVLDAAAPSAPKMVLLGDVVTMAGAPLPDGAVYLEKGSIVAVQEAAAVAPEGFADAPRVQTGGVIYPGLADLHNHLPYNVFSLWSPAGPRTNRSQWLGNRNYKQMVSEPAKVLVGRQDLLRALIRYVEVKLLLGGVTSGQGMHVKAAGGGRMFRGLVRNFEEADPPLPAIRHRVQDLAPNKPGDIDDFRSAMASGRKYFFHLAEGTDERARRQFTLLQENGFVLPNLVGIHSLGLQPEDLEVLRGANAAVVWSPLSNSILYGRTLRVADLLDAGVEFALGSDWTPSGSRNILQEMKVAMLAARDEGVDLPPERLARAVTVDAMRIAGWGERLGKVQPGFFADLLVVDRRHADPYENLLAATEREVRLVLVAGHARHGDRALMLAAGVPAGQLERITVGRRDKALHLQHPASPLNALSFAAAKVALERALDDLPAARDAEPFVPLDAGPALEVELDMQSPEADDGEFEELAGVELPQSVPLDAPTVVDDAQYWERLDAIQHLPAFLKGAEGLRRYYPTEVA